MSDTQDQIGDEEAPVIPMADPARSDQDILFAALRQPLPIKLYRMPGCEDATVPSYAHDGDAGMDIYPYFRRGASVETLAARQWSIYDTGVGVADLPFGLVMFAAPKTSRAGQLGISLVNTPGVIDASYRGEIKLIVINHSDKDATLRRDQALTQLILLPIFRAQVTLVDGPITQTTRGSGAFGSTNR